MFSQSYSLATTFGSTVMSSLEENRLAPFEGRSESASRNEGCLKLPIKNGVFVVVVSVLRITFSLSVVIPNAPSVSYIVILPIL